MATKNKPKAERVKAERVKAERVKVGDSIDLGGAPAYVRLPGGEVVTARGDYRVEHLGKHVIGDRVVYGIKGRG